MARKSMLGLCVMALSSISIGLMAQEQPGILVMVYNRSHTPTRTLEKAQTVAHKALQQAGIESRWLDCLDPSTASQCATMVGGGHIVLTLTDRWSGAEVDSSSLGLALPVEGRVGTYCYVFADRLSAMVQAAHVRPSGLLGYAMAHEIGHLLKGSNSHSPDGIMAAWWYQDSIRAADMGRLKFTEADRRTMLKILHLAE
jgi:hypothetical protein